MTEPHLVSADPTPEAHCDDNEQLLALSELRVLWGVQVKLDTLDFLLDA